MARTKYLAQPEGGEVYFGLSFQPRNSQLHGRNGTGTGPAQFTLGCPGSSERRIQEGDELFQAPAPATYPNQAPLPNSAPSSGMEQRCEPQIPSPPVKPSQCRKHVGNILGLNHDGAFKAGWEWVNGVFYCNLFLEFCTRYEFQSHLIDGKEEPSIGNQRKGLPGYHVTDNLTQSCLGPGALWRQNLRAVN